MDVVAHIVTFLTCTFAAVVTVGAIHHTADSGATRIKLAALIAVPPLLLLLADIPFLTILGYYLTVLATLLGLIYGLAFVFTAANYGFGTTLRTIANLNGTGRRPEPVRTQRTMPPPEPRKQQQQNRPDDTPVVFERQRR